jgi:site-specific DNA-methyltransferase (adenine-specific)
MLEKGKRKLNDLAKSDVLRVPRVTGGYPTEKPVALMEELIANSTQPDELVVDPFCGAGTTGVAAVKLGRRYFLGDSSHEAIAITRQRLAVVCTELFTEEKK